MRLVSVYAVLLVALAGPAAAKSEARKIDAPAKGAKSCVIDQIDSEFLQQLHKETSQRLGVKFYMKTSSYLKFRVLPSGALSVSIAEDTYPGSRFYFMVDGSRYSGDARYQIALDSKAAMALKQDKPVDFTYTIWPYRNEVSRKDVFSGFTAAYDECRAYLAH
jgi:hypothetical protein